MRKFTAKSFFYMRYKVKLIKKIRNLYFKSMGVKLGVNTYLDSNTKFTWPHQVCIGDSCRLEHNLYFHYDGIYDEGHSIIIGNNVFIGNGVEFNISEKIKIGNDSLIAAGCRFIDHNHGIELNDLIRSQATPKGEIILEEDVWLGANVIVLKGVRIGKGSVVAAGAIVNKNIPPYEIWGGVPAKKISLRK